jgi:ubiquitin carboxyl-terminal hydrolase L5
VINNACATQAMLSILLNNPQIELGSELASFKDFTLGLPPDLTGEAIGNSEIIREAHNSFARPEPFVFEEKSSHSGEEEDAFHFVSYLPHDGKVYELDGLKPGPIELGSIDDDHDWLSIATASINQRIAKYAAKEIRFNLMAIVKNRLTLYQQQLDALKQKQSAIEAALSGTMSDNHTNLPSDSNELSNLLVQTQEEIKDVAHQLTEEGVKQKRWKEENIRRRHNYVPFIFNVLKLLAEKGKLSELTQSASKIQAERNLNRQNAKAKAKINNSANSSNNTSQAAK